MFPIKFTRRQALASLSVLAIGNLAVGFTPPKPAKKPTFVLIHGAWHGGWCWKKVADQLRSDGYTVLAPTLTGLGERAHLLNPDINLDTHIQDVVAVLEYEDLNNVVLVGHSYGGMVITGVAGKVANRISQLVYLDAFLPENGKALRDYTPPPPKDAPVNNSPDNWKVAPRSTAEQFGVREKADIDWAQSRMGPQPAKTFGQPLQLSAPIPESIKKTYILLTEDSPWFLEAADRAKKMGYQFYKLLGGGHDAMISEPKKLAKVFVELI